MAQTSEVVYHGMGDWKKRKLIQGQRASRTYSKRARIYLAYPPATGWPGGASCEANGFKRKGAK